MVADGRPVHRPRLRCELAKGVLSFASTATRIAKSSYKYTTTFRKTTLKQTFEILCSVELFIVSREPDR